MSEQLENEVAQLENQLADCHQQDRLKTREINVLVKENRELSAELEKANACCAEMRPVLELCLEKLRFVEWNEYQGVSHWQIDNVSEEDLRYALRSTCGTALLEELREYRELKTKTRNRLSRMREIESRWRELGETECESIYRSAVLELSLILNEKETKKESRV